MKTIRMVAYRGKYSLRWAYLDAEGEVKNLSLDTVDVVGKNSSEFIYLLTLIAEARKQPIINVNSANKSLYFKFDLEED